IRFVGAQGMTLNNIQSPNDKIIILSVSFLDLPPVTKTEQGQGPRGSQTL
uniref:Uncharacterized protein n=1 Tax=Urocitellus parryii TaxID=9999 RepID=A0A8D2KBL3_UROPR